MRLRKKEFSTQILNKNISERNQIKRGGAGDKTIIDINLVDEEDSDKIASITVKYFKENPSASCICVILGTEHNVSQHWLSDDQIKYIVTLITEFCKQQKIELV